MPTILSLLLAITAPATVSHAYQGDIKWDEPLPVSELPGAAHDLGSKLRICSYNIQNFNDAQDDERDRTKQHVEQQAEDAAAILKKIDADIVLVQEIENASVLKLLNAKIVPSYPYAYITRFDYVEHRNAKINLAVLSRVPLSDLMELDFSQLEGEDRPSRGVLRFAVELGKDEKLMVYGVHLKSNRGERAVNIKRRARGAHDIRADMERVRRNNPDMQWHFMVVGDMNVDPDAPEFEGDDSLAAFSHMVDLWRGRPLEERTTHPTRLGNGTNYPSVAFDRFIVSPSLLKGPWLAGEAHVLKEGVYLEDAAVKPGTRVGHVSDHYPIYLDIVGGEPAQ